MAKKPEKKVSEKKTPETRKCRVRNRLVYQGKLYEVGDEIELTLEEAVRLYALLDTTDLDDLVVKKG